MAKLPHFGVDEEEKKKKKKKIQQAKATPLKVKTKTTNKKAKAKAPVKRTDDSTRSHTFNYNKDVKQKKKRNPLSFILRKTGNEAYGGLAGLEQAGSTEAINALKKGQKSKKKGTADTLKTFAEASFMPIHMLNSTIEAGKNFVKSKKSTKDKLINLGLDLSESMIDTKGIELVGKLAPKKTTKEAIKTIKEADEFVSKPYEKNAEKLNEESANYGQGTNFVADTMGVVGRMAPSIGATALTKNPNVGLVTMGVSAKGSSTKEALNRGADLDTAIKIGTAKGLIEVGTEKLTGGLHYLGKGSLDDIAEKGIQKTLSKVGGQGVKRALLDKGLHGLYDVLGENLEEWITDVVDTQIDKATVDPKAKYTLADWGQTTALTTASTIVLNLLTRGMVGGVRVDMDKAINQTENQLNTKFTDKEKNLLKDNALKDLMYKNAYDKANNRIQENKKLINKKVQEAMTLNQNKTLNTTEAQRNKINDAINIKTAEIQALKQQNKLLTDRLENNENFNSLGRYKSNDSRLAQIEQAIPSEMYDTPINIEAIEQNQYDNDSRVANLLVSARQNLNNSEASQSFVKMLSNLAENKGYNIVFNPDMGENINGRIVTNENAKTIELNPNSDKSATFVLMHELSHDIGTQEISEDINNFRGENAIFNEWYEKRSQLYREQTNLSEEEIQEEMMCDSIGELLGNEEYLNHLTTKPTLMQKIMDWINKFLGRTEKGSQEYNYLQQLKQDFERAYNGENITQRVEKNSELLYNDDVKGNKYATVAPYYYTPITENNFNEIKDKVDTTFKSKAEEISNLIGVNISDVSTNIGGFVYQEGELAGQFVKELSYTFELENATKDQADLFASLMGDLAYEEQEAVISSNFVDNDSPDADGVELDFKFKNIDGVSEALEKAGIDDYTIDTTNNVIKILQFDSENLTEVSEKIYRLVEELGGNFDGQKHNKIQSRYIDRDVRQDVYRKWLTKIGTNEQARELYNYITEASEKIRKSQGNQQEEINDEDFARQRIKQSQNLSEIETVEKDKKMFSTVAPYYSNQVNDTNYQEVRKGIENKFTKQAKNIASNLGIKIDNFQDNIGGYDFGDGEHVDELSYTFQLDKNTPKEDAKLFSCLMGDLGNEVQDSVIVGNYTDSNNMDANLEYTLKLNSADGIIDLLKEVGITDYTFNNKTNELQLLLFKDENGKFNESDILNKFETLNEKLGGAINEPTKTYVSSELIESKDRQNLYEAWLESNRKTKNRKLYNQFKEAYQKVKDFNSQSGDGTSNSSFSVEKNSTELSTKDSEGRTLSKQQQEYFKDSKVRDGEGRLIPVYHWTPNDFTVFDKDMIGSTNSSTFLEGFYFSDVAPKSSNGKIMKTYLDINNPIVINVENSPYDTIGAQELVDAFQRGETNYMLEYLTEYENYTENEANNLIDKWESADGVILKNVNYDYHNNEYIVFNSNQIKNVDNTNPTTNDDIRYSQNLISDKDNKGRKLTKEQQEYFKDTKVVDDDGNLKEVYHGSNTDFNVFKNPTNKYSDYASGKLFEDTSISFFTDSQEVGQTYINNEEQPNRKPRSFYLKMTKPYIVDAEYQKNNYFFDNDGKPTSVNNLVERIYNSGKYDGVIIKNVADIGFDYDYDLTDGRQYATDYVVFNSNQIKNVDNKTPTNDSDIRYSQNLNTGELVDNKGKKVDLQTSDIGNTGTLMAIHNLNENKLKGILELGGFPVPSIAITKTDNVGSNQFGDISVLFDKETINPERIENEVYDRDVWSPTFPQIDYELNEKGIEKVAKDLGIEEWRLRDAVEDSKPEYLVERLLREEQLIDKYINDNNIDYETAYKDAETRVDMHQRGKKLRKFIIDNDFDFRKLYQNKKLQQEYFDLIKDYYENSSFPPAVKENLYNEKINQLKEYIELQKGAGDVEPIRQLIKYQNDFDLIKSGDNKVVDTWQTEKNKKEASIKNGIEDYLQEEIKNVYGEKGIRNDREIFTPSGNRRSFWQLHDEYNLENIVDALTKGDTTGTQSWIAGFGQIQANMSNRFNSIDDIKANENKLTSLAENNEVLEEARNNIENDIDEIVSRNDTDITIVSELLADFARGDLTVENFKDLTSNYYQTTQNVPDSLINKIIDDMNNLKNLPTDYFEAKPQRAVGLDEVKAVVIPNNINPDFKRELQNKGLPIVEYDKNIEGDRNRVINQFDNIKFSQNLKGEEVKDFAKELADLDPEVMAQVFLEKEGDKLKAKAKENGTILTDKQLKQLYRQHIGKISPENAFRIISEAVSNRNYEIDRLAKITKNNDIKFWGDHINNMQGEIETNLNTAQIDENGNVVGKPVVEIFEPYAKDGRGAMFNDYLFHRSNIERHNNGVGSQVPMEESIQAVKDYEKENPDFKAGGDEVNNYFVNLLNFQVRCGIISQETANNILNKYKFYVPFYENEYLDDTFVGKTSDEIRAGSTLKRAQGGADKNLMPFEEAMARQTQQAISNGYKNELYKQIVNSLPKKAIDIMENLNPNESNALIQSGKKHYLTAFENGTPVQTEISQELYNELNKTFENYLKSVEKTLGFIAKPLQKGNEIKRNLVTTWSPSFVVTNPIKDIQDAFLNTKYPKDFAKNYSKAFRQILTGKDSTGELQKFLYKYGKPNIMGDYSLEGVNSDVASLIKSNGKINKSALAKVAKKIPQINEMLEMAPRYAEYLASLENGCSQLEALYNAREVTINFGRGGWFVKFLNRNGATFLNAQVQGFSKFFRNFHDAPVRTSMRATAYGLSMALINQLMYGDDDDYDLLPDYIKDNYYLFKVSSNEELKAMPKDMKEKYIIKKGKSTFIRIPRGRMLSIFSSMINRGKDRALGKRDELTLGEDIKSWGKNAWTQVGLPDIGSTNLFAPITQARSNKAWYGGQIVPNRLLKDSNGHIIPAKQQYDASTDKVSIWLGQKTGWSPYKINYVLDQYTGGIGDMLIPLITEEAQSSSNSRIGQVLAPLKDKFTADTINDNKNVTNFYTKAEKLGTKSLEENATGRDKLKSGYMDNVSYKMGALYKQIREVQADKNLSKKEKYERYEVLKSQINELAKNGLQNVNKVKGDEYYGEVEEDGKKKQLFRSSGGNYYELYDNQKEALDSANLSVKERNNLYKTKDEISKYMSSTKDNIRYSKRYEIIKNSNNSQSAKAVLYNQNKQYYQKDPTPLVKDNLVDSFLDIESQNIKSDYKNGKIVYNSKKNKIAKAINKLNISSSDKAKLFNFYYPNAKLSTSGASGSGSSKKGSSGSKSGVRKGSKKSTTTKTPKITRTKVTPVKLSNNKVKIAPVKSKSTSNSKYYQEALKNLLFK